MKRILKKLKKHQGSIILVADEARLEYDITTKPVWSKKGKQPIVLFKGIKKSKSFYGALNVKTGKEIVHQCDWQNQTETISFLEKIRQIYRRKRILLIWDNASWHKSKEIRKYLKGKKNLELMNFPPYSPELNPQEIVWKKARQKISHNRFNEDFQITIDNFKTFLENNIFKSNFLKKYKAL